MAEYDQEKVNQPAEGTDPAREEQTLSAPAGSAVPEADGAEPIPAAAGSAEEEEEFDASFTPEALEETLRQAELSGELQMSGESRESAQEAAGVASSREQSTETAASVTPQVREEESASEEAAPGDGTAPSPASAQESPESGAAGESTGEEEPRVVADDLLSLSPQARVVAEEDTRESASAAQESSSADVSSSASGSSAASAVSAAGSSAASPAGSAPEAKAPEREHREERPEEKKPQEEQKKQQAEKKPKGVLLRVILPVAAVIVAVLLGFAIYLFGGLRAKNYGTDIEAGAQDTSSLVVYFYLPDNVAGHGQDALSTASKKSGRTIQEAALQVQGVTGADLYEIRTRKLYRSSRWGLSTQSRLEQKYEILPRLAAYPQGVSRYKVLYVGYPLWNGSVPMPVLSFLSHYDLSGVTVMPFVTGADSTQAVQGGRMIGIYADQADVREGKRMNAQTTNGDILSWLEQEKVSPTP